MLFSKSFKVFQIIVYTLLLAFSHCQFSLVKNVVVCIIQCSFLSFKIVCMYPLCFFPCQPHQPPLTIYTWHSQIHQDGARSQLRYTDGSSTKNQQELLGKSGGTAPVQTPGGATTAGVATEFFPPAKTGWGFFFKKNRGKPSHSCLVYGWLFSQNL